MDLHQEIARLEIVIHGLVNELRKTRHDSPERTTARIQLIPLFPHLVDLKRLREEAENDWMRAMNEIRLCTLERA